MHEQAVSPHHASSLKWWRQIYFLLIKITDDLIDLSAKIDPFTRGSRIPGVGPSLLAATPSTPFTFAHELLGMSRVPMFLEESLTPLAKVRVLPFLLDGVGSRCQPSPVQQG
jgi:hypothetical protein